MPRYSEERKAAVLKKLLPPQNCSVVSVAAEEGLSNVAPYSWLKQCRQQRMPVPGNRNTGAVSLNPGKLQEIERHKQAA